MFVIVVPIFDPITIGMVCLTGMAARYVFDTCILLSNSKLLCTPVIYLSVIFCICLLFDPAIAITIDMVVEELCIKAVAKIPIISPATGLDKTSFSLKIFALVSPVFGNKKIGKKL